MIHADNEYCTKYHFILLILELPLLFILFLMMSLQLLCLLTFWLLLRQALTERRERQTDTQLSTITVHVEGKTPISLTDQLSQ